MLTYVNGLKYLSSLIILVIGDDSTTTPRNVSESPPSIGLPPIGFSTPDDSAVSIEPTASHFLIKLISTSVMILTAAQIGMLIWSMSQLFFDERERYRKYRAT